MSNPLRNLWSRLLPEGPSQ